MRLVLLTILLAGCPAPSGPKSGKNLTVDQVVDRLSKAKAELKSFTGEAVMDYWFGNDRIKGSVLVMGEQGAKVRVAALSPAGGSTMAEMVCDGTAFTMVDHQNNCVLQGPCNKLSIAQFFGIELDPDDFLHLALGTPPLIEQPKGSVTWDAGKGREQVVLEGAAGKQTLAVDDGDTRFDVTSTELVGPDGKTIWSVDNGDFKDANDPDGKPHRVPGKSHFKSPQNRQADLIVEWQERTVNVAIEPQKLVLDVPAGLATCGQRAVPKK